MKLYQILTQLLSKEKGGLLNLGMLLKESHRSQAFHVGHVRNCGASEIIPLEQGEISQRKLLKVAILGRPNAGKSTLINQIVNLNVCDVSHKTHTTRFPVRTAFVRGDTQIIFVDTPGVVTKKEYSRFSLIKSFKNWTKQVFSEVDIIGVIHDASAVQKHLRFHSALMHILKEAPERKPVFLILNKVDLVKNKKNLLEITNSLLNEEDSKEPDKENDKRKFTQVFFISALNREGVDDVVNYLLPQAKEREWILKPGEACDVPLHILITNLLRAKMLSLLPQEVPYQCSYEVEYLNEDEVGGIVCVALIKCKYSKHHKIIVYKRKDNLRILVQQVESDLYKILGKNVRLRVVVVTETNKS